MFLLKKVYTASIGSTSSLECNFLKKENFNIGKTCTRNIFYIGLVGGTILDCTSILFKIRITFWALRVLLLFSNFIL